MTSDVKALSALTSDHRRKSFKIVEKYQPPGVFSPSELWFRTIIVNRMDEWPLLEGGSANYDRPGCRLLRQLKENEQE
jgi:hypothetical protein